MSLNLRFDKGPLTVLQALATGDQEQIDEAIRFQRESFRAKYGCYPEECEPGGDDEQIPST